MHGLQFQQQVHQNVFVMTHSFTADDVLQQWTHFMNDVKQHLFHAFCFCFDK